MEYDVLLRGIMGIFAYDMGAVSSGIRDETLRAKIIKHMKSLNSMAHRVTLAEIVIDMALCPEALRQGYGPEDALEFLRWCEDQGILITDN